MVVTPAGIGANRFEVIQDYLSSCSPGLTRNPWDIHSQHSPPPAHKTKDYYMNLANFNEIIQALSNPNNKEHTIKTNVNILRAMLKTLNLDKVRLMVDTRALLYVLPYANSQDVRLREAVLDILCVLSQVFPDLNAFNSEKDIPVIEEKSQAIYKYFSKIAYLSTV